MDDLLAEAQAAPNKQTLVPLGETIATLREKDYTYRDIAEWLCERGFDIDHNAVYRIFIKHLKLSDADEAIEERNFDEEERNAAP